MSNSCKFKMGDVIKIKVFDSLPDDWESEHLLFMGKSFIVNNITKYNDVFEIYVKGIGDFYFLESEIVEPVVFNKMSGDDFEI